jgi:hypothetical protein
VALRTREQLTELIASGANCNAVVRPEATGSPKYTKLQPTAAEQPDQRCGHCSVAVRLFRLADTEKRPAICGGCESREETTN